jgi:hypothetical protein
LKLVSLVTDPDSIDRYLRHIGASATKLTSSQRSARRSHRRRFLGGASVGCRTIARQSLPGACADYHRAGGECADGAGWIREPDTSSSNHDPQTSM